MFNCSKSEIILPAVRADSVVFLQTGHSLLQKSAKGVTKGCQLGNSH
jgi:hypothetical protein